MKVGTSKTIITPPCEVALEGYSVRKGYSKGVHDDLYVSCVYVEIKGERFVAISLDLLGISNEIDSKIRDIIYSKFNLPRSNILVSATHTHSGPVILGLQNTNEINLKWMEMLPYYVEGCVSQAINSSVEAKVKVAETQEKYIVKNRRQPEGIVDPTLTVVEFLEKSNDKPLSMIINYTCHPTVLDPQNLLISADYIYYIREEIKNSQGMDFPILFFNGAEGNINIGYSAEQNAIGLPINTKRGFPIAEKIGKILAFDTLSALEKEEAIIWDTLKVNFKVIRMKTREPRSRDLVERQLSTSVNEFEKFALQEELSTIGKIPEAVDLPLQLISTSNLSIFAIPGEPFVEIGLKLREFQLSKYTMIVGLANGYFGYIPLQENFKEGGYETRYSKWSFLSENTSKFVIEAFKSM